MGTASSAAMYRPIVNDGSGELSPALRREVLHLTVAIEDQERHATSVRGVGVSFDRMLDQLADVLTAIDPTGAAAPAVRESIPLDEEAPRRAGGTSFTDFDPRERSAPPTTDDRTPRRMAGGGCRTGKPRSPRHRPSPSWSASAVGKGGDLDVAGYDRAERRSRSRHTSRWPSRPACSTTSGAVGPVERRRHPRPGRDRTPGRPGGVEESSLRRRRRTKRRPSARASPSRSAARRTASSRRRCRSRGRTSMHRTSRRGRCRSTTWRTSTVWRPSRCPPCAMPPSTSARSWASAAHRRPLRTWRNCSTPTGLRSHRDSTDPGVGAGVDPLDKVITTSTVGRKSCVADAGKFPILGETFWRPTASIPVPHPVKNKHLQGDQVRNGTCVKCSGRSIRKCRRSKHGRQRRPRRPFSDWFAGGLACGWGSTAEKGL
jgi:hypothetical protein